ncbi:hypothetical protein [Streptomyces vastus]|uniref:hypothetical protein n=1 Tax=Streptomyces vastus TaxID=285451 RepID=UPI0031D02710
MTVTRSRRSANGSARQRLRDCMDPGELLARILAMQSAARASACHVADGFHDRVACATG